MLGSQALETAIGLVLLFFVLSLAASAIVELVAQVLRKRADYLEQAIGAMLAGHDPDGRAVRDAVDAFKGTSVYEAAKAGARRGRPSYLSAKAFAEGVGELLDDGRGALTQLDRLPAGLRTRIATLARQPVADAQEKLLVIKSGIEQWFDETMARLEGAYKRWVAWVLFGVGLLLAVVANASTFHVADRLWNDQAVRDAVSNAAAQVVSDREASTELRSVAETTEELDALGIPVGWDDDARSAWSDGRIGSMLGLAAGWLLTAVLVSLGAPFWFDLLTKLVALRATGKKPPPASTDPASATTQHAAIQQRALAAVAVAASEPGPVPRGARAAGPAGVDAELARAFGLARSSADDVDG